MKTLLLAFIISAVTIGCCHDERVTCKSERYQLATVGYTIEELRNTVITWRLKGDTTVAMTETYVFNPTQYKQAGDTLLFNADLSDTDFEDARVFISRYDVQFYIPNIQRSYNITNVRDEGRNLEIQRSCWNTKPTGECFNPLVSYTLDGRETIFSTNRIVYLLK